jgi:hypothetical protein
LLVLLAGAVADVLAEEFQGDRGFLALFLDVIALGLGVDLASHEIDPSWGDAHTGWLLLVQGDLRHAVHDLPALLGYRPAPADHRGQEPGVARRPGTVRTNRTQGERRGTQAP